MNYLIPVAFCLGQVALGLALTVWLLTRHQASTRRRSAKAVREADQPGREPREGSRVMKAGGIAGGLDHAIRNVNIKS